MAEATRACHVSASAAGTFYFRHRVPCAHSGAPPQLSPPSLLLLRATRFVQNRLCKDRRTSHPLSSPLLSSTPLPSLLPSPSPAPFASKRGLPLHRAQAQKGGARKGARGHAAPPLPLTSPLSALPRSRGKAAHEGTPPPRLRSHPVPLGRPFAQKGGARRHDAPGTSPSPLAAPPRYVQEGGTRGHATPGPTLPHSHGRGVREGMPPPLPVAPDTSPSRPVRAGWRHARARHPAPPFPIHAEGGARGHPAPYPHRSRPLPPWPPRPYARTWGTRAHTGARGHDVPGRPVRAGTLPPGPTLPHSRGRGRTEWMLPRTRRTGARRPRPPLPLVRAAPFARKGGMRGLAAPSRGAPFAREWAHEAKTRGLRAPAFTAPAPRLRGIVRLRQKIDVA
ncbi:hypothetical protein EDB85DRAFT_2183733 [Lactarius pseudohatsudake]|nr:hypothetical protein EDB85DRAFT_2183733 [Lactarius pseudohatsudake]